MTEATDDRSDIHERGDIEDRGDIESSGDARRRRPTPDRARKRAIRARANQAGVSYLVAARHLNTPLEPRASLGRTVYPDCSDEHRRWLIALREQRSYKLRADDARQAILIPLGRARHLVERFPSLRGEPGSGLGRLYDGEARPVALAMLYTAVIHERADLAPPAADLAWLADLGEETAVDLALCGLDRAARELLELDRWDMWTRIDAALSDGDIGREPRLRDAIRELGLELRSLAARSAMEGARQTLDAVLTTADGGHAPGTRVRILTRPFRGRTATIVGIRWARPGPPIGYEVRPDEATATLTVAPKDLTLLRPPLPHPRPSRAQV